jgi:hypothetical protein
MGVAKIDANSRASLTAVSSVDGTTVIPLWADPTTHRLLIDTAGSSNLIIGTSTITGGSNGKILYDNNGVVGELTNNFEVTTNKATDFTTINNTLYPTVQAVNNQIITSVTGLLDYSGSYNASVNTFPATGGSGTAGAILKGDFWICSVAGTLGGTSVTPGDLIIALVDTPGQTSSNWDLIQHDINGAYVTTDQTVGQTLGATGARLTKLWVTDITVTNSIIGSITGNAGTVTGAPSGSFVGTTDTQTLTNKRVTKRVLTSNAPGATPTTNTDNVDIQTFTGLATAITSMTTNLSGTPVDGDKLEFRFLDNGTAQGITWGASFVSSGTVTLPATTVISTLLRVGFEYQTTNSVNKWVCIATA